MKKLINSVVLFVFIITLSGCATIANPKTTSVSVNSNPEGATVYFDNMRVGKTPLVTVASNLNPLTVSLKKEGYEEISKRIGVHASGGCYIADCFLPPVYGCLWIILDAGTGAANNLNETKLNFTLDPILPTQPVKK